MATESARTLPGYAVPWALDGWNKVFAFLGRHLGGK